MKFMLSLLFTQQELDTLRRAVETAIAQREWSERQFKYLNEFLERTVPPYTVSS